MKANYITTNGFKKLTEEQDRLLRFERPEVTKLVTWAASNGDRSENADYIYGKKRLREIDRRLRFLQQRIEAAIIVDPSKMTAEKIQFGATVTIEFESTDRKTISIVGVDEIDTEKNHLSWQSPIGRSLIGKELGDVVEIQTPSGSKEVEIIDICYRTIE